MRVKGSVVEIKEVQVISDKFKKQEVILKQEGVEYDADIPIEFIQDKGIELVSGLKVGSSYEIDINISGRAWKDRHFVSLKAWKVSAVETTTSSEPSTDDMPF
ncbi:MAG: DUF3127 domain-containing protein [Emcibacteraceae bacterium]|nr:DUF3127 domain-containing protein [Emcibacteraceae bacterium]